MHKYSNPESGLFSPRFLSAFFLCSGGVLLALASFAQSPHQPNLTPNQPAGWSDKIVVSNVSGTHSDSAGLFGGRLLSTDTLYLDWAVLNGGSANIDATFTVELYVDDVFRDFWTVSPSASAAGEVSFEDYNLGSLGDGPHTLRIRSDATNSVAESNEADNEYTKTITVGTNDNFINRTILTGSSGSVYGRNSGATKEAGEPLHAGNAGGASIWYSWTAPFSDVATFYTGGVRFGDPDVYPGFDTLLAVYTGNTVNSLNVIASNDDSRPEGRLSSVTFNASAGVTYRIAIDGKNGDSGWTVLRWQQGAIFTITTTSSPSNGGTAFGGGTFFGGTLLSVTATANSGFNFVNWTENGNVVSTLATYPFTLNNNRNLIANFNTTPTITIASSPAVITEGASAVFTISASTVNASQPIIVNYIVNGKAFYGTDYALSGIPGQITIPAGASSAAVTLNALTDNLHEKKEKVVMTLQPGTGYRLSERKPKATVTIAR